MKKQSEAQRELLEKQSEKEEIKERNVKVFEKKSEVFNQFIEKLWNFSGKRSVGIEELAELFKLVSKNIIPYAKPENSQLILKELNKIAEFTKPNKDNNNKIVTRNIQSSVFEIINILSNEIGLGGKITPEIATELNALEDVLMMKNFKDAFIEELQNFIDNSDTDISKVKYHEQNMIWCDIGDFPIYLIVNGIARDNTNGNVFFGFYIDENEVKRFSDFREATRYWRKDYLKGLKGNIEDIINLNDIEQIRNTSPKEEAEKLGQKILSYYSDWRFEGKNIRQVVEECESKNN